MKKYSLNNVDFLVNVIIKPKNLNSYIHLRNGIITISSYKKLKDGEVEQILSRNFTKLKKALDYAPKANEMVLLGKTYTYKIIEASENRFEISENMIIQHTTNLELQYVDKQKKAFLVEIAKKHLEELIPDALTSYGADIDFPIVFKYKFLKTCYGRCTPKKREIVFSGLAATLDIHALKYVVYHELAHFKYLGHQADFYAYLVKHLPNALELRKKINKKDR